MNFFQNIAKTAGNEYAALVSDGVEAGDVDSFIDTGSYIFNALLSGSIFGGLPSNKITAIAGESATGKTFFVLGMVKNFLDSNPDAGVLYFESESAITRQMIEERGIDSSRMVILPVTTVQEFRTQSIKVLDKYIESDDKKPMMLCLDSLGMLSTTKEVEDTADGKETRDMTRAQVIKAAFRVLTLKLGRAKIPMIVTNHTYDVVGSMFPTKEMGGGCLVKGTKIKTENGFVSIEDIKVGDCVNTLLGIKPVLKTFNFDDKEVYEIEFEDGSIVRCTGEHKFMMEDDNGYYWIPTDELVAGDNLVVQD